MQKLGQQTQVDRDCRAERRIDLEDRRRIHQNAPKPIANSWSKRSRFARRLTWQRAIYRKVHVAAPPAVNDHVTTLSEGADRGAPGSGRSTAPAQSTAAGNAAGPLRSVSVFSRSTGVDMGSFRRDLPARGSFQVPYQVAVMMYDFSFGGVYDDAFSGTILIHIWKSVQRVYGRIFPRRIDRHSARNDDRGASRSCDNCWIRRSRCCRPDSGNRMVAAVDDLFRIGTERPQSSWCSSEHFIRSS